jgi:DNA-binding NarL/FixJ family response regulator
MKTVFLVDDHPTLRDGLRRLVEQVVGCNVCGEAASASEALETIPVLVPDLVVTDISLPDRNGLELIKDLRTLLPTTEILVFSMHDEMLYAERCMKAGAKGYLMKGAKTPKLLEAVERVASGKVYLSERMSEHILANFAGQRAVRMKLDALSDRELEVFELIGLCRNSSQISEQLNISPKTVDAHRGNIKAKLNLPDAPSLMREAVLWIELSGKAQKCDD